MFSRFGRLDFGGDLFDQWPVSIRFDIGLQHVSRAIELHEFAFGKSDDCILVSQDWSSDLPLRERLTPLFRTPDIFHHAPSHFETVEISPFDEASYTLTWTRLPPQSFDAGQMMQAIARRERGGTPAISSNVYTIDPRSRIIMQMYDDRGLDVIATETAALLHMYEKFAPWVLYAQRHRVQFRFQNKTDEASS
jgi:Domain of unknown function (DUF3885)